MTDHAEHYSGAKDTSHSEKEGRLKMDVAKGKMARRMVKKAKKKVAIGYHRMPNGHIMKNSDHPGYKK